MPASKIVLGVPSYGKAWVPYTNDTTVGAAAHTSHTLPYYKFCNSENTMRPIGSINYDKDSCSYFIESEKLWISYDSEQTFQVKVSIKQHSFHFMHTP